MGVILKVGDMVKTSPCTFCEKLDHADKAILGGWRNVMSKDPRARALIGGLAPKNICSTSSGNYRLVVDEVLEFVRSTFGHFRIASSLSGIQNQYGLLVYYDSNFPRIMHTIYKGCAAVEASNVFKFDLDNM
ncbi:hypothetical protein RND81_07G164000 [Saponaria officinalis]|uniref:Uncharacterized protein n=1 Tax=Saponaria officinalis TaxID=3572 RepID=A0AAW1JR08_SAPOF